jgi:DNA-binding CsgD family transcriptional regulator
VAVALTEKETATMDHLIAGKTDKEIAILLGVARRTVGVRIWSVCNKLGADTREQATALYVRLRR